MAYRNDVRSWQVMKITLRKNELKQMLSSLFKADIDQLIILPLDPSSTGIRLRSIISDPLDKSKFIGNIKTLRNYASSMGYGMTLVEGKWAIEHWPEFIEFVDEFDRLPAGGYGIGENQGLLK